MDVNLKFQFFSSWPKKEKINKQTNKGIKYTKIKTNKRENTKSEE